MYICYHEIKMEKRKIENEIIWAFFPSCDDHIQAIWDLRLCAFWRERERAFFFSSLYSQSKQLSLARIRAPNKRVCVFVSWAVARTKSELVAYIQYYFECITY